MKRRVVVSALLMMLGLSVTTARAGQWQPPRYTHHAVQLEDQSSYWGVYIDPPWRSVRARIQNAPSPSIDGRALKITLSGGQPYTGLHVYRNLMHAPASPRARYFRLEMRYRFGPSQRPIQALEFTMSVWRGYQRWEWALQWERVPDGTAQQGMPPTWRIWTGFTWDNLGVRQHLAADRWHSLVLWGDIDAGRRVQYRGFISDGESTALSGQYVATRSTYGGAYLSVGTQLDGDAREDPYVVYLDRIALRWT